MRRANLGRVTTGILKVLRRGALSGGLALALTAVMFGADGAKHYGVFSLGPMGQVVPETNVVSLPFIFKSVDQMHRLMDSAVGAEIGKGLEKKGLEAPTCFSPVTRSWAMSPSRRSR